jgi:hypothetical protein
MLLACGYTIVKLLVVSGHWLLHSAVLQSGLKLVLKFCWQASVSRLCQKTKAAVSKVFIAFELWELLRASF